MRTHWTEIHYQEKDVAMKTQQATLKTLHLDIGKGSQDVIFKELIDLDGFKLRISIRSDFYVEQCHAKIEIFDVGSFCWNHLADIHSSLMRTHEELKHTPNYRNISLFARDRASLLNQAVSILDLVPAKTWPEARSLGR